MILLFLGLLLFVFPRLEDIVKKNFRTYSCILRTAADVAGNNARGGRTLCLKSFSFVHYSSSFMKSYLQPSL